jgi:hypothetical protein
VTQNGDLLSNAGSISFAGGKVAVQKSLSITSDSINFNGSHSSVTTSDASALALVPKTAGTNIVIDTGGSSAGTLGLNANALDGYGGSLFIGALPVDFTDPTKGVQAPPSSTNPNGVPGATVAGDITVNGDIALSGTGSTLVITSSGSLNLNSTLQADNIIIGGTTGVFNPNNAGDLVMSNSLVVVGDLIGQEGKDIAADASGGAPNLVFATHGTEALFKLTGVSKVTLQAGDTASTYAGELDVQINTSAQLQNSGTQAAANSQTGGLLGSGFIDVSVFQQISLYDVNGSGIQLPSDQCEEESSTGTGCGQ